jgi:hypothetical protein
MKPIKPNQKAVTKANSNAAFKRTGMPSQAKKMMPGLPRKSK